MADLKEAVGTVLEGWTLPHDVRKILETAYYADTPTPVQADHSEQVLDMVQAEQSLEVVAEVTGNGGWRIKPIAPELPIGMKFADHAQATAEIEKRDAEIAELRKLAEARLQQLYADRSQYHDLRTRLEAAEKDAERYRYLAAALAKNATHVATEFYMTAPSAYDWAEVFDIDAAIDAAMQSSQEKV